MMVRIETLITFTDDDGRKTVEYLVARDAFSTDDACEAEIDRIRRMGETAGLTVSETILTYRDDDRRPRTVR